MKDIVLAGLQGSGKSTQAKMMLEEMKNYKYLEMGQILRALNSNDNIIGNYVHNVMTYGGLVKDCVTSTIFEAAFKTLEEGEFLLIDGFPRKIPQMHDFLKIMKENKREFVVIVFEVSKEEAIKRLMKRAEEQGRKDDTPEGIAKRIELYYEETLPVIEYLKNNAIVKSIDGSGTREEVLADVQKNLAEIN